MQLWWSIRNTCIKCIVAIVCMLPTFVLAQGRIDCSAFNSHILHHDVRYCVMLPTNYQTDTGTKHPVLYFLHGLGENEQALLQSGGWGLIEDLRRDHKVGDFLMVAPEGRGSLFITSAGGRHRYRECFVTAVLQFLISAYRVLPVR